MHTFTKIEGIIREYIALYAIVAIIFSAAAIYVCATAEGNDLIYESENVYYDQATVIDTKDNKGYQIVVSYKGSIYTIQTSASIYNKLCSVPGQDCGIIIKTHNYFSGNSQTFISINNEDVNGRY